MKITQKNLQELEAKLDSLEKALNGGKGSGNFGHAGRPGQVGGSSRRATTTARLARADKVAELDQKAREAQDEYERVLYKTTGMSEDEYEKAVSEARQKKDKAEAEYEEARRKNQEESEAEIAAGQAKKSKQDTPGKAETKKALDEVKAAIKNRDEFIKTHSPSGDYSGLSAGDRITANVMYEQISTTEMAKLEKATRYQMDNDKQFQNDVKQHIEDGLGIKVGEIKFGNPDSDRFREATIKVSDSDKGIMKNILPKMNIRVGDYMPNSTEHLGDREGRISLEYQARGRGSNGQNLFTYTYSPDGTYIIKDRRGK